MIKEQNSQKVDENVQKNYEILCRRIQDRIANQDKVSFLFSRENTHAFTPDYFVLNEIGQNSFQRLLNISLSRYAWPLWKNFFLRKITARLLKPVQNIFKPKILSLALDVHAPELMRHWEASASHVLKSNKIFRNAVFYEVFLFLTDSLSDLLKILEVHPDLFSEEKLDHHRIVMAQYPALRNEIMNCQDPQKQIELCLFASSCLNQFDLMNHKLSQFMEVSDKYMKAMLNGSLPIQESLPSVSYENLKRISRFLTQGKKNILFECDNCGEILVDLIFVEILLKAGHGVTLACKENFILNDVTQKDLLEYLELAQLSHLKSYLPSKQLKIIHTGSSIPGKYLFEVPQAYQDCYLNSDCLILKGEGNFQTMPFARLNKGKAFAYFYKKPIFYALSVKTSHLMQLIQTIFGVRDLSAKSNIFYYYSEPLKD
jgi:uncharacterized protein with ATP-grasp and redox domains